MQGRKGSRPCYWGLLMQKGTVSIVFVHLAELCIADMVHSVFRADLYAESLLPVACSGVLRSAPIGVLTFSGCASVIMIIANIFNLPET